MAAIASILGIHKVLVHKYSSVLSAYGMALADVAVDLTEPSSHTLTAQALQAISYRVTDLKARALCQLEEQGVFEEDVYYETYLNLRYLGSDTSMMIIQPEDGNFERSFKEEHKREFSFNLDKPVLIDDIRVRGIGRSPELQGTGSGDFVKDLKALHRFPVDPAHAFGSQKVYFKESQTGWIECPIYRLSSLEPGTALKGPG